MRGASGVTLFRISCIDATVSVPAIPPANPADTFITKKLWLKYSLCIGKLSMLIERTTPGYDSAVIFQTHLPAGFAWVESATNFAAKSITTGVQRYPA